MLLFGPEGSKSLHISTSPTSPVTLTTSSLSLALLLLDQISIVDRSADAGHAVEELRDLFVGTGAVSAVPSELNLRERIAIFFAFEEGVESFLVERLAFEALYDISQLGQVEHPAVVRIYSLEKHVDLMPMSFERLLVLFLQIFLNQQRLLILLVTLLDEIYRSLNILARLLHQSRVVIRRITLERAVMIIRQSRTIRNVPAKFAYINLSAHMVLHMVCAHVLLVRTLDVPVPEELILIELVPLVETDNLRDLHQL
mmetsp:Transcript_46046/g.103746  ORF Transcript_46046/g.103746 Transcript_46046/m.103746 type:complete len:256 (-) Transcript_46046:404-1171(-)